MSMSYHNMFLIYGVTTESDSPEAYWRKMLFHPEDGVWLDAWDIEDTYNHVLTPMRGDVDGLVLDFETISCVGSDTQEIVATWFLDRGAREVAWLNLTGGLTVLGQWYAPAQPSDTLEDEEDAPADKHEHHTRFRGRLMDYGTPSRLDLGEETRIIGPVGDFNRPKSQ